MKCNYCGNELKSYARFCPQCGTKVSKTDDTIDENENISIVKSTEYTNVLDDIIDEAVGEIDDTVEKDDMDTKLDESLESITIDNSSNSIKKNINVKKVMCYIVPVFVGLICTIGYLCWYYMRDTIKDFEYNYVEYKDHDSYITFYYDEDAIFVPYYYSDASVEFSIYPSNGKLYWCSDIFSATEFDKSLVNKDMFTSIFYEIPGLKSKYNVEKKYETQFDSSKVDSIKEIYRLINELKDEEVEILEGKCSVNAYFNKKSIELSITTPQDNISIALQKKEKDETIEVIKQRVKSVYSADYLEGIYYQEGTEDKLTISDDNVYVEDDFTVSMIIQVNNEEKHVPYDSVLWAEQGCTVDGTSYILSEETRKKRQLEQDFYKVSYLSFTEKGVQGSKKTLRIGKVYIDYDSGRYKADAWIGDEHGTVCLYPSALTDSRGSNHNSVCILDSKLVAGYGFAFDPQIPKKSIIYDLYSTCYIRVNENGTASPSSR